MSRQPDRTTGTSPSAHRPDSPTQSPSPDPTTDPDRAHDVRRCHRHDRRHRLRDCRRLGRISTGPAHRHVVDITVIGRHPPIRPAVHRREGRGLRDAAAQRHGAREHRHARRTRQPLGRTAERHRLRPDRIHQPRSPSPDPTVDPHPRAMLGRRVRDDARHSLSHGDRNGCPLTRLRDCRRPDCALSERDLRRLHARHGSLAVERRHLEDVEGEADRALGTGRGQQRRELLAADRSGSCRRRR